MPRGGFSPVHTNEWIRDQLASWPNPDGATPYELWTLYKSRFGNYQIGTFQSWYVNFWILKKLRLVKTLRRAYNGISPRSGRGGRGLTYYSLADPQPDDADMLWHHPKKYLYGPRPGRRRRRAQNASAEQPATEQRTTRRRRTTSLPPTQPVEETTEQPARRRQAGRRAGYPLRNVEGAVPPSPLGPRQQAFRRSAERNIPEESAEYVPTLEERLAQARERTRQQTIRQAESATTAQIQPATPPRRTSTRRTSTRRRASR